MLSPEGFLNIRCDNVFKVPGAQSVLSLGGRQGLCLAIAVLPCPPLPLHSVMHIVSSLSRMVLCDGGMEAGLAFLIRVRCLGMIIWRHLYAQHCSKNFAGPISQNPPSHM